MVAPRRWVEAVRADREIPVSPPALNQLALALFMESGAYDRHLRASRRRFRARRGALVGALQRRLPGYPVRGADAGLDLLLELPPGSDADAIVANARRQDMWLCSVDDLRFQPEPGSPGLILGYGNLNDSLVDEAVAVLAGLIRLSGGGADAGGAGRPKSVFRPDSQRGRIGGMEQMIQVGRRHGLGGRHRWSRSRGGAAAPRNRRLAGLGA